MINVLWLVVLAMPIFLVSAISRNHRRRVITRSATASIGADADGVSRTLADGRREEVTWAEVTSVDVFTARMGPHKQAGGAVVLYGDATRGCIVPFDELGSSGLLDNLWRLPGFELDPLLRTIDAETRAIDVSAGGRNLLKAPPRRTREIWVRPELPAPPDAVTGEAVDDPSPDTGDDRDPPAR